MLDGVTTLLSGKGKWRMGTTSRSSHSTTLVNQDQSDSHTHMNLLLSVAFTSAEFSYSFSLLLLARTWAISIWHNIILGIFTFWRVAFYIYLPRFHWLELHWTTNLWSPEHVLNQSIYRVGPWGHLRPAAVPVITYTISKLFWGWPSWTVQLVCIGLQVWTIAASSFVSYVSVFLKILC